MRPRERWPTVRAPGWWARGAFLAVAAAGHVLFLTSVEASMSRHRAWAYLAAPNLIALGRALLRRASPPLRTERFAAELVALTAAWCTTLSVGMMLSREQPDLAGAVVFGAFFGAFGGALGAAVALPLALAVDRWRREPSPRSALDAWAALACCAALFVFTSSGREGLFDPRRPDLDARALHVAGLSLAVALALGLFVAEVFTYARLARARSGRVSGLAVTDAPGESWGDVSSAPSWRMTATDRLVPLVRAELETGYRDDARDEVVAMIPATATWSWRVWAMPAVAVACVVRLAL